MGNLAEQKLPEDAEAGGGLMAATIQLAITAGRRSATCCAT
jgi:hypothetical protein